MDSQTAVDIINDCTFLAGWDLRAECFDRRHETGVAVYITYTSPDYSSNPALWNDPKNHFEITTPMVLLAGLYNTEAELMKEVIRLAGECWFHEAREACRRASNGFRAVLHPHRIEGMVNWGRPEADLAFGNKLP